MERRKTDSEIQHQVLRELKWDSLIGWAQIGVDVGDGVVTLSGVVNTYGKKSAAQQAAHRVAGVLDVANDLKPNTRVVLRESSASLRNTSQPNIARRSDGVPKSSP